MSNAISGAITIQSTLQQALDAGTNRLVAMVYPASIAPQLKFSAGTGPNQANKVFVQSGTAAASPVTIDLTATTNADGSTGFSHVRALLFFNTDTVDGHTFTFTEASNFFAPWLTGTTPAEATEAGGAFTRLKPYGTNGWVVDGTHKILTFDPGANTIPYTLLVLGD